jgi:hypothetical protein
MDNHPRFECKKEKTTPAKCANCNGEHFYLQKLLDEAKRKHGN